MPPTAVFPESPGVAGWRGTPCLGTGVGHWPEICLFKKLSQSFSYNGCSKPLACFINVPLIYS